MLVRIVYFSAPAENPYHIIRALRKLSGIIGTAALLQLLLLHVALPLLSRRTVFAELRGGRTDRDKEERVGFNNDEEAQARSDMGVN